MSALDSSLGVDNGVTDSKAPVPVSVVAISDGGDPIKFAEVAVRALGLLVENTGCVVVPYLDHSSLLGDLLEALQHQASPSGMASGSGAQGHGSSSSGSWAVRREVMRLLGILGALDPYRHRMACIAAAQRSALAMQVRAINPICCCVATT